VLECLDVTGDHRGIQAQLGRAEEQLAGVEIAA